LVATNTTIARPLTSRPLTQKVYDQTGGLSGRPLRERSTEVIRHLYRQTRGQLPIIGVGGIFSAQDAWEKIQAGASLVQVYTGMVYQGPGLAKDLVTGLLKLRNQTGEKTWSQIVGST
jgi:dihydroorotate dehydrogenase